MKLSYEQIYVDQSSSLKIESYRDNTLCNQINWHIHPEYEIVFIRNGKGTIQVSSKTENYTDGVLIFLGPNIPHIPFGNKQHKNNVEVVIQFSENFVQEKLSRFPEFDKLLAFIKMSNKGILFSKEIKQELASLFLSFAHQNCTEQLLNFLSILYQLSVSKNNRTLLKSNSPVEINKNSLERVSKVFEYINTNYAKKIRSETLAKQLGLTPNSFCRMFKSATDMNFIHFLNEFRIKKAQEFFENKNIPIIEVVYKSGFNDPSYFCKQFKKYTGVNPSTYIKQLDIE
ncbi:AraC family transcriptional regulator [Aquimarina sp. RZ0]|uniref:AraC family transcriptional regulator n=1 Tax=Aquimarina sp. RZ0 TaxID=2607730 RepID=UPI0011F0DDE5|nr:AraC family transcriptional regulator [Aquimarina sp. RZ0]KAA1247152.1 helix-turn-helix transcriptional regulator [Aquimarina sp. RZ0]